MKAKLLLNFFWLVVALASSPEGKKHINIRKQNAQLNLLQINKKN